MQKPEKILLILGLVALVLKVFNLPSSDIIWMLSLNSLAIFYYVFGAAVFNHVPLRKLFKKDSYKGISKRHIVASVAMGWVLAILCVGLMFRLLFLPGSMAAMFGGFTFGMAGLLLSSFFFHVSKKDFFKGLWARLLPAVLITYALVNIPLLTLAETLEPDDIELHESIQERTQD